MRSPRSSPACRQAGARWTRSLDEHQYPLCGSHSRRSFRKNVVEQYRSRETPPREARSAVLTAGAPGAGKSALLREHVAELYDYRPLDADVVKDFLIEQALTDGIYDDLLDTVLADGARLAPRELAALVHDESTALIDQIRRECLDRGENVLIEGTLRWPDHGPRVFAELVDKNYTSLRIIGVEVPRATAHEQALSRWWEGRRAWCADTAPLGGRFTPPAAIDDCYDGGARSAPATPSRSCWGCVAGSIRYRFAGWGVGCVRRRGCGRASICRGVGPPRRPRLRTGCARRRSTARW
ncbi:putative zeta toxin protein [Rhodococcus wratislaviensis IFP 2016]|nr:putative zeta toxin protein [Rhodococcus wratislaviensis IFP 2016]